MLLMLVDHAREFSFYGCQVGDPMDLATTSPGLFFTRASAHLCPLAFVALTGLAAWLHGAIRALDGYGEPVAWQAGATPLVTAMSFLNLTQYPPSLDFLLPTLGAGALILAWWEGRRGGPLALLGGAPLFFVLHLYVLHLLALA